jgi:uncharacterized membrane protein YgcG
MKKKALFTGAAAFAVWALAGVTAYPAQPAAPGNTGRNGYLELECNISRVDISLCPQDKFIRKTKRSFFGLLKSEEEICSEGQFFLGTTPMKPLPVAEGRYVLLIPSEYAWEHPGPIEIDIRPGEKTFFPLKLFKRNSASQGQGPTGSSPGGAADIGAGSGMGGGSGSGGTPGTGGGGSGGLPGAHPPTP